MKLFQIFIKTPNHRKFSYTPRFYNPEEEERKAREERIRKDLEASSVKAPEVIIDDTYTYRTRIAGSFRKANKSSVAKADPSTSMLRLIILLILAVGFIAYIQFGAIALYVAALVFVPLYFFLKFRNFRR
jgi:Flp pilus assembly protein TadB